MEVLVKTGFATTICKRFDLPMPNRSADTDTIEKLEALSLTIRRTRALFRRRQPDQGGRWDVRDLPP
jgi:hypothetical protein